MPVSAPSSSPHIPVLLHSLLRAVEPVRGIWLDGTFGAGGYARGLLDAGADHIIGVDRDPLAHAMAESWVDERITLIKGNFADLDQYGQELDGVVLDLGVSSMQLDQAERGFSFMQDGPLDMRMAQHGVSAAEIVNTASEAVLADILFHYGEERASRRISRAIVRAREQKPFSTTLHLAEVISACLPRPKPGQSHPATRSFQALRIAVNDEYRALWQGLMAAERALKPDGMLAVVSFHSIEDRMVKRFLQLRSGRAGGGSRYAPEVIKEKPQFTLLTRKAINADDKELEQNSRARSALLRVAKRTDAPASDVDPVAISMPQTAGPS